MKLNKIFSKHKILVFIRQSYFVSKKSNLYTKLYRQLIFINSSFFPVEFHSKTSTFLLSSKINYAFSKIFQIQPEEKTMHFKVFFDFIESLRCIRGIHHNRPINRLIELLFYLESNCFSIVKKTEQCREFLKLAYVLF